MDIILQGNIAGISKWKPHACTVIYIGHSIFFAVSVALVINPSTVHDSQQFHVVFDDEFSIVTFIREVTIPPNWKDIVQLISQKGAPNNIDLKDTLFTPDIEEYPRKTPTRVPKVALVNNKNEITLLQTV